MAGGAGTRMWPASRANRPKQVLRLFGGVSLLRAAYDRVVEMIPPERICVITRNDHLQMVAEELPEVPAARISG